jgi:predicted  nucleic acid-binding Zn-ribbon protein
LAVAALVLSCQNYDDEFDALNSKIASLESQITSLAELRTAVTGVQSSISALQTAVAAAQAAAEAAGDAAEAAGDANAEAAAANTESIAALATSVAAIAADLVDLQTAIDGATTEADLDALKAELNTTLAALQTLIETNSASISSLITSNTELKDALDELGIDVESVLAANATFEGNLTITNAAELAYAKSLGSKVASIKGDVIVKVTEDTATVTGNGVTAAEINTVLSQMTFVVGNVRIETNVSLDLSALTTVSGDYSIVGHDIDDSALASVGDDVYVDYDGPVSFPALATADRIYVRGLYVTKAATATAAAVIGTTSIDFMGLTKATSISVLNLGHTSGGAHTSGSSAVINDAGWPAGELHLSASTTSVKINQAPVTFVTGAGLTTLELHYKADKTTSSTLASTYPGLSTTGSTSLGSLSITAPKLVTGTVMARQIGTVTIDAVSTTATAASGTVNFPEALFVGAITSDALVNTFPKLVRASGISLANQVSVSLPELTRSIGDISLPKATAFSAAKLAVMGTAGTATTNPVFASITAGLVSGSVALPELTQAENLSFGTATSIAADKARVNGSITLDATATSVDVLSVGSSISPTSITTLKLHGQRTTFGLSSFTALTSLTYKGYAASTAVAGVDLTIGSVHEDLASVTVGGRLNAVVINTGAATKALADDTSLTTVITEGTIHAFSIADNWKLATLTLGHKEDAIQGIAPLLSIDNNRNLKSITTSVTKVSSLVVKDNVQLATMNFSSISTLPANYGSGTSTTITISGNYTDGNERISKLGATANEDDDFIGDVLGIKGTYSAANASSARVYGQSQLATLKSLFTALDAKFSATAPDPSVLNITLSYRIASDAISAPYDLVIDGTAAGGTVTTTTSPVTTLVTAGDAKALLDELLLLQ